MSDIILHECGTALFRLRKPISYYIKKYGSNYALTKMYILMEKQHNRGQDGAGVANIKINQKPGLRYINRHRSVSKQPVVDVFQKITQLQQKQHEGTQKKHMDEKWLKENVDFTGELWLGHLRYGTHGLNGIENVHPFMRQNNWRSRNLVIAGNFNMTNVDKLFDILIDLGQHPKEKVDTVTVMEKIGHFLDEEVQKLFRKYKNRFTNIEVSEIIEREIRLQQVLKKACQDFDGGYTIAGLIGSGAAFVVRDPCGIRPAYYYADDEVVVVASEKPAIKTAFDIPYDAIKEIPPGRALVIAKNGDLAEYPILKPLKKKSCSFERIYFSRGTDPEIYRERKQLGAFLAPEVLKTINFNLQDTIFSYVPNSAESAFLGMLNGISNYEGKVPAKNRVNGHTPTTNSTSHAASLRVEKIVVKDAMLRTFITNDQERNDMIAYVYDTTYEVVNKGKDTLVIIDDSIVRGTTLEKSILKMLDRLEPKKIVIVSSAPQIRFPDCYGIDMSCLKDLIAFRSLIELIKDRGKEHLLTEVYEQCLQTQESKKPQNHIKKLYDQFTYKELSKKISQMVTPPHMKAELEVVFQTIENLHKAIPNHRGDWYFTGNYPTPGGVLVANKSYINYIEGRRVRAY